MAEYGTEEDLRGYIDGLAYAARHGFVTYRFIPMNSYIISFWVQYGIVVLCFWIYVMLLVFLYFKRYACAIPQWYGYLCVSTSAFMWDVFFSPFSDRLGVPFMICCILFVKAVYEQRLMMPYEMERAAQKVGG